MNDSDMFDVNGGLRIRISKDTVRSIFSGIALSGIGVMALYTMFMAATIWINSIPGLGSLVYGFMGISGLAAGLTIAAALVNGEGVQIELTFQKVWFAKIPTGVSWSTY